MVTSLPSGWMLNGFLLGDLMRIYGRALSELLQIAGNHELTRL
jgi:hypothetical protein